MAPPSVPACRWLTPPIPAALAVLRVPAVPALLDRPLPAPGVVRLARLLAADGNPVDEVLATALDEGLELTVHGGAGVRAAVTAALASHGLTPAADGSAGDPAWDRLAAAAHPAAVRLLLADPTVDHPFLFRQPQVLIAGPANAGKSSLLNAWCGRPRAVVAEQPGTTRDLVAVTILAAGWRLRLIDSAGERPAGDALERAGQDLARAARAGADLVLWLDPPEPSPARPQPGDLVIAAQADRRTAGGGLSWSDRLPATAQLLAGLEAAVLARLGLA